MVKKITKKEEKQLAVIESFDSSLAALPAVITDEKDAFVATDIILQARRMTNGLDDERTKRTAPANETIKLINNDYNKYLKPLKKIEDTVKASLEKYAEYRITQDTARLLEARKATGDDTLDIPIGLTVLESEVNAMGQVRFRTKAVPVVVTESIVPAEYLTVDMKKIEAALIADPELVIPGVELTQKVTAAIYANA